jgi:hypothetical protein
MAIPFLNNISINNNEIQNVKLHNTGNIPSPGPGQIYFDTDDSIAKYWNGVAWIDIVASTGGTVTSVTSGNTNTITVGGTATNPTISANTAAVTNGSLNLATGDQIYDFVIGLGYVESVDVNGSTFIAVTDGGTSADPTFAVSLAATGSPSSSTYLRGDNTWAALPGDPTITLTGEVTGSGTTSIATTVANGVLDVANFNGSAIVTVAEGIENNNNDTTLPTSAAVKAYVDASTVGGLVYQGGYDAATNTPNLDSTPIAGIKKGWTYTVTADGLFFTEQVRVGDVLIAEIDSPTTLADWTTVQNNIDIASASQIGIGNVAAGSGVDVSYANGTATVSLTAVAARSGSIAVPNSATYTYPNSITASSTNNVLIQLVDSNGETVYADVQRLSTTTFSVNYGVTTPTGVVALIQLIG